MRDAGDGTESCLVARAFARLFTAPVARQNGAMERPSLPAWIFWTWIASFALSTVMVAYLALAMLNGLPVVEWLVAVCLATSLILFRIAAEAAKRHIAKLEANGVKPDDAKTVPPSHPPGSI